MNPLPTPRPAPGFLISILFAILCIILAVLTWKAWTVLRLPWVSDRVQSSVTDYLPEKNLDANEAMTIITPSPSLPLTGSGVHACDSLGICNTYDNPNDRGCPITFADPNCLNQCGTVTNRCPQTKPQ